jgi:hypothetical protein
MATKIWILWAAASVFGGCVGGDGSETGDGSESGAKADDNDETSVPAPGLGTGDHTASSVALKILVKSTRLNGPTGLAFAKDRPDDLWIVNEDDDSWTIVDRVSKSSRRTRRFYDDSAHFLNSPTSLSFSDDSAVATCQENTNDYNGYAVPDLWMGATVWTSNRSDFEGGHMSHYDMAHEMPLCMGIAWESEHRWFAFNGYDSSIDLIDYHGWHPDVPRGLGGHDHTDGEIFRFAIGEVSRVPGVPSHMVHDPNTHRLYVADSGNGRIVRLPTADAQCQEALGRFGEMPMYHCSGELEEIVPAGGDLEVPSGIALHEGLLYVTDHATGVIHAYTTDGAEVNWLDTGLGSNALTGIAVRESDGAVFFLDRAAERLYRVDP